MYTVRKHIIHFTKVQFKKIEGINFKKDEWYELKFLGKLRAGDVLPVDNVYVQNEKASGKFND